MIAREATGFIYVVSSMGVTGVRSEITTDVGKIVGLIKEVTDTPTAVGFGINTAEQVHKYSSIADGAIVGSAIVKIVARYGGDAGSHIGRSDKINISKAADIQSLFLLFFFREG